MSEEAEIDIPVTRRDPPPPQKFKKGQIVVMKSVKRETPFRILDVRFEVGEWCYAWDKKNYAAEHMLREQTPEEKG